MTKAHVLTRESIDKYIVRQFLGFVQDSPDLHSSLIQLGSHGGTRKAGLCFRIRIE